MHQLDNILIFHVILQTFVKYQLGFKCQTKEGGIHLMEILEQKETLLHIHFGAFSYMR